MTAREVKEHEGYLVNKDAAAFLGVKTTTLTQWRFHHRHPIPCFVIRGADKKRGGRVFYRKRDLILWMEMDQHQMLDEGRLTGRGAE